MPPATPPDSDVPAPALPSWWSTIWTVIAGTIVAWAALAIIVLPLSALHVVPLNSEDLPGTGWPWRIDGPWAFLADLGPVLGASFAFAAAVGFYLRRLTGVPPRRWPLALLAAAVGWIPIVGSRPGLIGVGGGLAFVLVVWAARRWSLRERRPTRLSRPQLGALLVTAVALCAVSFSYGALHPLTARGSDSSHVKLRNGRAKLVLNLENAGPFSARVLGVRLVDPAGLRLERLQTDSERDEASTPEGLFRPLGKPTLDSGEDRRAVYLTVASRICMQPDTDASWMLEALNVRLRTAGTERTQRVALSPALRVRCHT